MHTTLVALKVRFVSVLTLPDGLLQAVGQYAEKHCKEWDNQAIANTVYGLGLLRYSHGGFLHAVAEHVSGQSPITHCMLLQGLVQARFLLYNALCCRNRLLLLSACCCRDRLVLHSACCSIACALLQNRLQVCHLLWNARHSSVLSRLVYCCEICFRSTCNRFQPALSDCPLALSGNASCWCCAADLMASSILTMCVRCSRTLA